jgi:hypothetical protein
MIRLGKETQVCEWGLGTSTLNQVWTPIATGALKAKAKNKMGATVIHIEVDGKVEKKNDKDNNVKVMQKGESMTPTIHKHDASPAPAERWGEVATGTFKGVRTEGSKTIVEVEISGAMKIGTAGPG